MLMAEVTEGFEQFLVRFVRKAVIRLLADEDIQVPPDVRELEARGGPLLAQIRMAVHLRAAVDRHIEQLTVFRGPRAEALLAELGLAEVPPRPTWSELGEALGVSAQAAHRKYGPPVRKRDDAQQGS